MTATKLVAEMKESPGTYLADTAVGGVFLTRRPEDAKAIAIGETLPRGFKIKRVSYEVEGGTEILAAS